jgi:hypothetical protein
MSRRFLLTSVLSLAAVVLVAQAFVQAQAPSRFPPPKTTAGTGRCAGEGSAGSGSGGTVQVVIVIVIVTSPDGNVVQQVPFSGPTYEKARSKAQSWINTQKKSVRGARYQYEIGS